MDEDKDTEGKEPGMGVSRQRKRMIKVALVLVVLLAVGLGFYKQIDYILRVHLGTPERMKHLRTAIDEGDIETVRRYISAGVDLDALPPDTGSGSYPLAAACFSSQHDIAKLLLENGASPNPSYTNDPRNLCFEPPITLATMEHDRRMVEILLEYGADPNRTNPNGRTALHEASVWASELAPFLVEHGADPNAADVGGMTPLHQAACAGETGLVTCYLANGADPNKQDLKGRTALHYDIGDDEAARTLLDGGADPNIGADMGSAKEQRTDRASVSVTYISHGLGRLRTTERKGWTPLHCGAAYSHVSYIKLLLEHGARVDIKDAKGRTPMDIARLEGHADIVTLLEEWTKDHPQTDEAAPSGDAE